MLSLRGYGFLITKAISATDECSKLRWLLCSVFAVKLSESQKFYRLFIGCAVAVPNQIQLSSVVVRHQA